MKRNFNLLLMAFAVFGLLSACEDMPMEDEKTDDTEQNQGGTGNEDGKEEGSRNFSIVSNTLVFAKILFSTRKS